MALHPLPFALAATGILAGDTSSGSHDLLYGTVVTAFVTLILGLAGIFFTRPKPTAPKEENRPTPGGRQKSNEQLEIEDLKRQRDALQRKDEWKTDYILNLRDTVRRLGEDPNLAKPVGDEP